MQTVQPSAAPEHLWLKMASRIVLVLPALVALIFVPAGTLAYWQAWVWLAVLFVPMVFALAWLYHRSPDLLMRRLKFREKHTAQKRIINVSLFYLLLVLVMPGLDFRFGWSNAPVWVVLAADAVFLVGYGVTLLVFSQNRYAARTVEVEAGQQVITTGLYAFVRHPMYLGVILMYVSMPLALGSYWTVLPALLIIPILVARIRSEEAVLTSELKGYPEYMQQTRYRLLPGVW